VVTQDTGTGVLDVTGRREENEWLGGTESEEMVNGTGRRRMAQFGSVAAGELGKPIRVVARTIDAAPCSAPRP
jgi:hypothetical protein